MTESSCAHRIANLEGRKRFKYRDSSETKGTLQALDIRLQRLETASGFRLMPPMLQPTLESLDYRIHQVENGFIGVTTNLTFGDTKTTTPVPKTLEDVEFVSKRVYTLVNGLTPAFELPAGFLASASERNEAEELLDIAQRLCFIAGLRDLKVADFDDTVLQVYELAVLLTLSLSQSALLHHGRHPMIRRMGPPPPPPQLSHGSCPGSMNRTVKCGHCCSCDCRGKRTGRGASPTFGIIPASKNRRWWFRLGSVKKLWCFGRRGTASSLTSSSTDTLTD